MPPSRTPRHAAPAPSRRRGRPAPPAGPQRRRTTMLPAVLLLSVGAALGGLAVLPRAERAALAVTAAAASSPEILADRQTVVSNRRDLTLLDSPPARPDRPPARASRTRRAAPVLPGPVYVRPGIGRVSSGYKWRWGRMHQGVDLAGPYGSPVRAVTNGVVLAAGWDGAYGYAVKLLHPDGTVTFYAHNAEVTVTAGQQVVAGQVIAREGNTGRSTGPHVHFEVRINDVAVNPIAWLAARGIYL